MSVPASRMTQVVDVGELELPGLLLLSEGAKAIVLFAHGSGSGRSSPRNRFVAKRLQESQLGALLFDLLLDSESHDSRLVFDIDLLSGRLIDAAEWVKEQHELADLPLGYFGASTGAAAALVAAAERPDLVGSIVSRGGRTDMADWCVDQVQAPTLLIVGEFDEIVLAANQRTLAQLNCQKALEIVPAATHLFAEPGALEQVAQIACTWFLRTLAPPETAKV